MILRHPGISPTNDLVAKKSLATQKSLVSLFAICWTYQQKIVTILEGSNIHVLPSLPYSVQDFYTSIDVLAELDKWNSSNHRDSGTSSEFFHQSPMGLSV